MEQKLCKERVFFPSSSGRADIEAVIWHPKAAPRALLVLVHGMQEHVERYEALAQFLTASGFLVCGHNQIGHGGSLIDNRGGIFPRASSTDDLVADCRRFLVSIRREFPFLPCFLMGHSFGSFVARAALTDSKISRLLGGVILSGTAGEHPGLRNLALPATRMLTRIFGAEYQSSAYDRMANHTFSQRFPGEKSPHCWVSSMAEEVDAFDNDPKMDFILSLGAYRTVLETLDRVSGQKWARQIDPDLPILLLSGGLDPVGEEGRGVRQVASHLLEAGSRDLTLYLEPNARHELLHEPCRDRIMELIRDWIEKRL